MSWKGVTHCNILAPTSIDQQDLGSLSSYFICCEQKLGFGSVITLWCLCIYELIHPNSKYLVSSYDVLGTMLGGKDKTRFGSILLALRIWKRRQTVPIDNWITVMYAHACTVGSGGDGDDDDNGGGGNRMDILYYQRSLFVVREVKRILSQRINICPVV